jgi:hypothetical protein
MLGLFSVGLGLFAVGMSYKSDRSYTTLLGELNKSVNRLPILFRNNVLFSCKFFTTAQTSGCLASHGYSLAIPFSFGLSKE